MLFASVLMGYHHRYLLFLLKVSLAHEVEENVHWVTSKVNI